MSGRPRLFDGDAESVGEGAPATANVVLAGPRLMLVGVAVLAVVLASELRHTIESFAPAS